MTSHPGGLPGLTRRQWILSVAIFVVSSLALLPLTTLGVRVLVFVIFALGIWLVVDVVRETMTTRLPGKLLLVGCVQLFFWLEAALLAMRDPPFPKLGVIPLPGSTLDADLVRLGIALVGTFQLLLLVGFSIRPRMEGFTTRVVRRVDLDRGACSFVALGLAYLTFVPPLLAHRFDLGAMIASWLSARSGDAPAARDIGLWVYLAHVGAAGIALALALAVAQRGWRRYALAFAVLVPLLPVILSGSRINLLFVVMPAMLVALRGARSPSRRQLIVGALVLTGLFLLMMVQLAARLTGWGDPARFQWNGLASALMLGQFIALVFALHLVPLQHAFFQEPATPYFLLHWVPRPLWPEKPVMESWVYYNDAYTQGAVLNVTPSIVGQYWINWGFLGVVAIAIWVGFLAYVLDRVTHRLQPDRHIAMLAVAGAFAAFLFASFRFYSPIYITAVPFALIAALLATRQDGSGPGRNDHDGEE